MHFAYSNSKYFTFKIHYGGKFLDKNALEYISGKVDYFDNHNVDLIFKLELDDMVE